MDYREKEELLTKFQYRKAVNKYKYKKRGGWELPSQEGIVYCEGVKVGDVFSECGKEYPVAIQCDEQIQKELDVWFPIYKRKEEARIYNDNLRAKEIREKKEREELEEARKAMGLK